VDATGFNYAWGQVPQMPADYPVAADLLTNLLAHFQGAGKSYQVHVGTIATSDSFMSDSQRIAEILERQPGLLASDMESAALAQVLASSACQVLNIRGISDHVGVQAPQLFKDSLALAAQNAFDAVLTVLTQII
ncbi:MAG: 5'-methylthioadenosine/S-adenosylhomocysteine nucleosidase, partial [Abiotrophia defectiva]|nr:5'-methylthioadenosine/S-adenosylhomocysteine nucleosidase [Abiotrophia defectiva]